jgi:choline dehydrogenase-like flavoprotein
LSFEIEVANALAGTQMPNNIPSEPLPDSLRTRTWDVAVLGAGLGGATLGYDLARRGYSVLFMERGLVQAIDRTPESTHGIEKPAVHDGWWPADLIHHDGSAVQSFRHPLGCGTGGSSAMFGMVMERFRPEDFEPRQYFPGAEHSTVPEAWPISYKDLEPFYDEAERLYRVRGESDPLFPDKQPCLPPPPATNKERLLLEALAKSGLHPYRFHYACERVPECDGCVGKLCPRHCRNDAHRMCIVPALETYGADLVSDCRVERLECSDRTVTEIVALQILSAPRSSFFAPEAIASRTVSQTVQEWSAET